MKRVLTALILVPVVLVLVFLAPKWLFMLATAAVAILAGWEMMSLTEGMGARPPRLAVCAGLFVLFVWNYQWPDLTLSLFTILCLVLVVFCAFRSPTERMLVDSAACILTLLYTGLTLLALPELHEQANGPSLLVFLLCAVWAGDIAALYVGRAWGRHKLAPRLSPNKSWEGAIASVLGSLAVTGMLLGLGELVLHYNSTRLYYSDEAWWYWLLLAAAVNIAAQVGDLAESGLKRSVGVKDSGSLLPGHGGVLDRIDALLLAAPVLWCLQELHLLF